MNFEEKIDAMRTTLELAILDIEAQRAATQELRASIQELRASIEETRAGMQETRAGMQETRAGIHELRMLSESQYENVRGVIEATGRLAAIADSHERRITSLETRS